MTPVLYTVTRSGAVVDRLKALLRQAAAEGRWDAARRAVEAIERGLRWVPGDVGEPVYVNPSLGQLYFWSIDPVWVVYAVHPARREVFVRAYGLLP